MNVLGICCGRKNGNTEIMMKEVFKAIEEKCGATCRFVNLQDAHIAACTGCEACMINHLKGNWDFRCVTPRDADNYYFIEQYMRQADAIIVSSPAYNLMPTGILVKFLNKLHASGDYRHVVHNEYKVGAAFSLGGTDWTNFTLEFCNMTAMELCGSYDAIVDKAHFDFVPSAGAVVLEKRILDRMSLLGKNVAEALIKRQNGQPWAYVGEMGICPDCHGNKLELREDGAYCPQCLTKATVTLAEGVLKASFTEEARAKNRWSPSGQQLHDDNIRMGHGKAMENKELINQKRREYGEYDCKIAIPKIGG